MKEVMKERLGFIALIVGIVICMIYLTYTLSSYSSMVSKQQFQLDSMKIATERDSIRTVGVK